MGITTERWRSAPVRVRNINLVTGNALQVGVKIIHQRSLILYDFPRVWQKNRYLDYTLPQTPLFFLTDISMFFSLRSSSIFEPVALHLLRCSELCEILPPKALYMANIFGMLYRAVRHCLSSKVRLSENGRVRTAGCNEGI